MKIKKYLGVSFFITIFLICLLFNTCSVKVDEKLKDPYFTSWLSEKSANEIKELKKDGNYYYSSSNINKWETFYIEWDKLEEHCLTSVTKVNESTILYKSNNKKIAELKGNSLIYEFNGMKKEITINKDEELICLDKHGNIILDDKFNPILLKPFKYKIKVIRGQTSGWTRYGSPTIIGRYIYPCIECDKITGIKNAFFIW